MTGTINFRFELQTSLKTHLLFLQSLPFPTKESVVVIHKAQLYRDHSRGPESHACLDRDKEMNINIKDIVIY